MTEQAQSAEIKFGHDLRVKGTRLKRQVRVTLGT